MGMKNSQRSRARRSRRQGFTLVEIMIVVLIISVLCNMALPSFIQARNNSQEKACITNLRHIQDAKQEWAIDYKQPGTAVPQWSDIAAYIHMTSGQTQLFCPTQGGTYTINDVDDIPFCNQYGGTDASPGVHYYYGD